MTLQQDAEVKLKLEKRPNMHYFIPSFNKKTTVKGITSEFQELYSLVHIRMITPCKLSIR